MSFESDLRTQLLRGAEQRRRTERRQKYVLAAAPVLLIALLLTAWWTANRDGDGSDIGTSPGLTADAAGACDALLSRREASTVLREDLAIEAFERFVPYAEASGDEAFTDLAQYDLTLEPSPDELRALDRALNRCRELGAPGFAVTVVPAAFGPEPVVDLADYGTVQLLQPTTDTTDLPIDLRPIERNISPIRLARSDDGLYVVRYEYDDLTGRASCLWLGLGISSHGSCGGFQIEHDQPLAPLTVAAPGAAVAAGSDVSFVVFERDGTTFVQRPVDGIVITAADPSRGTSAPVRAYAADGTLLSCIRLDDSGQRALSC